MREGLLPCKYPRSQWTQGLLSQLEMLPSVWKVWIIQSCHTIRAQVIRNPLKPEVLTPLTDWSTFFWSLHKLSITKFLIKIPLFSKSLLNDRTAFFSFVFFLSLFLSLLWFIVCSSSGSNCGGSWSSFSSFPAFWAKLFWAEICRGYQHWTSKKLSDSMYLYLFDFIPDHFVGIKGIITGRNHLFTGYFCSDHWKRERDWNANEQMPNFTSKSENYIDGFQHCFDTSATSRF